MTCLIKPIASKLDTCIHGLIGNPREGGTDSRGEGRT
jgi:hypothetical protein